MFRWFTNWLEARRIRKEMKLAKIIRLNDGEILVFEHPAQVSELSIRRLHEGVKKLTGGKAVILTGGLTLTGAVPYLSNDLISEYGDLAPQVAAAKAKGQS